MDKPKVDNPMIMAQALIRALLLNTDGKANSAHTDCPACLWEDQYNIDIEKLRNYHSKESQITLRNKRDYEHKILQNRQPTSYRQDNHPTSRDTLQPKKSIKWIRKKDIHGLDKASPERA